MSIWKGLIAVVLWLLLAAPSKADLIYVVEQGDSAWSIAVHFGITLDQLYAANGWAIDQDPVLQIGQCIAIPTFEKGSSESTDASAEAGSGQEAPAATYIVQSGDNPFLIAQRFRIPTMALLAYNNLTENDLLSIGQVLNIPPGDYNYQGGAESLEPPVPETTQPELQRYIVQAGDNPWSISRRFSVSIESFLACNSLTDQSVLHPGDEVRIPAENNSLQGRSLRSSHTVIAGDTLGRIAQTCGVPLPALLEANGLTVDSQIRIGQQLVIPGYRQPSPESAPQSTPQPPPPEDLSNELVALPGLGGTSSDDSGQWHSEIFDFRQIPAPEPSTPNLAQEAAAGQWSVDGHFNDGKPYHKYTIRRGDTLGAVAHAFNVTQSELMSRNGLDTRSMLRIGRDLSIPLNIVEPPAPRHSSRGGSGHSQNVGAPDVHIGAGEGTASGRAVVEEARKHLGTPYVWSGTSLTGGSDCSGFTSAVYSLFGISLPHRARDQADCGVVVEYANLQPGDLVFFHTTRSGISHVGIYIGGGDFIHSSSHRGGVTISPLDTGYYNRRFVCARRVL